MNRKREKTGEALLKYSRQYCNDHNITLSSNVIGLKDHIHTAALLCNYNYKILRAWCVLNTQLNVALLHINKCDKTHLSAAEHI